MNKLLVFIALTGLLSSGVESFRISEKEYENIDRMLQFGVQVFLNCLDKVKEATEKLVKEDMLRTNRIAIQENWNSFRETANRISVEESGKGVQDDLLVAARTVRRLVLHYKDDIKKTFHSLATEQNVRLYLPVVNMFKGTIERAKVKEIWGTLVANYLPDAPSIESEPLAFLCYLLSTNTMETFIVNALKFGVDAISQLKSVDFDEISEWVRSTSLEILRKFYEIEQTEQEMESDKFLLTVRVASRVLVFYWDRVLNVTDTPELRKQFESIWCHVEDRYLIVLHDLLTPLMEWETVKEFWELHFDFARDFYLIGLGITSNVFYYAGPERCSRTVSVVSKSAVLFIYPIFKTLSEEGVLCAMEKLYLKAVNTSTALIGHEEVQYFRETSYNKSMEFIKEINRLVREERQNPHFLLPQVWAIARMSFNKFGALADRINADIDDHTIRSLITNWGNLKIICVKKLLASGALTQDELDEAERMFVNKMFGFLSKFDDFTQGMDQKRVEDIFKALVKLVMVGLNFIYAPLTQALDTVVI
ncbi:uncharacterized protein LOC118805991 [Colossoma macropomum]|uniref:uncharacterized protein LOC118805991 n=1 Tax=Colossoma macropomum TaxID=42526 RepID=UPI001863A06B|nr:uncharacterized protein LOC118805991 [Colossoma macropomum]